MMRGKFIQAFLFLMGIAILTAPAVRAQDQQPAAQPQQPQTTRRPYAYRETDMGFSIYQAFTAPSTGNGVQQNPSNAPGGFFELRHIHSPFIGYEVAFGYNNADANFAPTKTNCGYMCNNPPQALASRAFLVGLDWVVSRKYGPLRPFAVGGLGFFIDEPSNTLYPINDVVRVAYTYGGGVDWAISHQFGLRAQFRGNIYSAPNLSVMYSSTGKSTYMNQPMAGVFYRF
ncbi:MAG: outer membrane protein [Acidobacteriota bacterium]